MFYCQTFPWGLEHRMGGGHPRHRPTTFLLDWACGSFLLGLRGGRLKSFISRKSGHELEETSYIHSEK